MIGYYVHHHGRGHLHRAIAIAEASSHEITGLSSLPRPAEWRGEWVRLDRDDESDDVRDVTAGGRLHWVPVHDHGLRSRMAAIAAWIDRAQPTAFVVDVSVEVAVLARLHGVPVATFTLPGQRGDDPHQLGFGVADVVLACWPPGTEGIVHGLDALARAKLHPIGAISRFRQGVTTAAPIDRTVLVLSGAGGSDLDPDAIRHAEAQTPGWRWTVLDGTPEHWVDDPWPLICSADVVVTHAGQNALADVAAARRPAIVVPQVRPHGEQLASATALARAGRYPVLVRTTLPVDGWSALLESARRLDGTQWAAWNDGLGASRAATLIERLADRDRSGAA